MKPWIVAPEAEGDLREIWRYLLSKAGPQIADRVQQELLRAFDELADCPGKGHRRVDLTARDVFFFSVYQYMVVYRRATTLEIVAVLHGKRDVGRLLQQRAEP